MKIFEPVLVWEKSGRSSLVLVKVLFAALLSGSLVVACPKQVGPVAERLEQVIPVREGV